MADKKLVFAGAEGPKVVNTTISPETESTFGNRIHNNFKYGVFPHWKPESEVLALNWGVLVLASLPGIPAAVTVNKIFDFHKMYNYRFSRLPSAIAAGGIASSLTFISQTLLVEGDIITSKFLSKY